MEIDLDEGRTEEDEEEEDEKQILQLSPDYFSSTDDELDKVGRSEGEWEGDEEKKTDVINMSRRHRAVNPFIIISKSIV